MIVAGDGSHDYKKHVIKDWYHNPRMLDNNGNTVAMNMVTSL